jgi:hypothetical protein
VHVGAYYAGQAATGRTVAIGPEGSHRRVMRPESSPAGADPCEHRLMAREQLTQTREPLRCPRCGVAFAIVVGAVGPCEPCQLDLQAEARREARAEPRPCAEGCGQLVTGAGTYCSGTCRSRAHRRRQRVAS